MLIAEQFIQTPYKKYLVNVKSVAVRKLTIMEWTFLRIVNDYSTNPPFRKKTLAYFFEDVLGMDHSELLIRPCINALQRMGLAEVEGYSSFAMASNIVVGNIKLSDKGKDALFHNYIPGADQETEESVFYDLLGQRVLDYFPNCSDASAEAKKITALTRFSINFPGEEIVSAINNGYSFPLKYKKNDKVALDAVCNEEEDIWCTGMLLLEQDEDGVLHCNYPLSKDILGQITRMTECPFKDVPRWNQWPSAEALPTNAVFSANIQKDLENVVKNAAYIAIPSCIWPEFSRKMKKAIKGTTCIILGDDTFSIEAADYIAIHFPIDTNDSSILLAIPGADTIRCASFSGTLEDCDIPISFSYHCTDTFDFGQWFQDSILNMSEQNPELISLLFLPFVNLSDADRLNTLQKCLTQYESINEKLGLLNQISACCNKLRITSPDFEELFPDIIRSINIATEADTRQELKEAYSVFFKELDAEKFEKFVVYGAAEYGLRSGIMDTISILTAILSCRKASVARVAEAADRLIFSQVSDEDLDELFSNFEVQCPDKIPELTWIARSYNTIVTSMKLLSGFLPSLDWYADVNRDDLLNDIINCEELKTANRIADGFWEELHFLDTEGCSAFSENGPCGAITEHLMVLRDILSFFVVPDGSTSTIYIIDTCAFLHSPDILTYFRDDEMVRIPFTVLRELDYHKDHQTDLGIRRNAAYACKQIECRIMKAEKADNLCFAAESQDYPELLPSGFDCHKHDDLILSSAFRYKMFRPCLLTDDTNFRNIARTQGIEAIAWAKFIEERGGKPIRGQAFTESQTDRECDPETEVSDGCPQQQQSESVVSEADSNVEENLSDCSTASPVEEHQTAYEIFLATPLTKAARRFGMGSKGVDILRSAEITTVAQFAEMSELKLRGLFKKKQLYLNQMTEAKRKITAELKKLAASSAQDTNTEEK